MTTVKTLRPRFTGKHTHTHTHTHTQETHTHTHTHSRRKVRRMFVTGRAVLIFLR